MKEFLQSVRIATLLGQQLFAGLCVSPAAVDIPQDNWMWEGQRVLGEYRGLILTPDRKLITSNDTNLVVFDTQLQQINTFPRQIGILLGLAHDSKTNIYTLTISSPNVITVYSKDGSQIGAWGERKTGNTTSSNAIGVTTSKIGQQREFPNVTALAIDANDEVYIADTGSRIMVFDTNGSFLRSWGTEIPWPLAGSLQGNRNVAINWDGDIEAYGAYRFSVFSPDGDLISSIPFNNTVPDIERYTQANRVFGPDGIAIASGHLERIQIIRRSGIEGKFYSFADLRIRRPDFPDRAVSVGEVLVFGTAIDVTGRFWMILQFDRDPEMNGIYAFERRYNSDRPLSPNSIPLPRLQSVKQRAGSPIVDIEYEVIDPDSSRVDVALLGFSNGGASLSNIVQLNSFVDGSGTNIGSGMLPNTLRTVSWDAVPDWNIGFGSIQLEVLAKDERGLLPINSITIPNQGEYSLAISNSELSDEDFLSVWFWLIAGKDPSVLFSNGAVFGVGGAYEGVTLAHGELTTDAGRQFVYERIGVRAITIDEVNLANQGNFGFAEVVTTNHVVRLIP